MPKKASKKANVSAKVEATAKAIYQGNEQLQKLFLLMLPVHEPRRGSI
jgi:hypothetical protein